MTLQIKKLEKNVELERKKVDELQEAPEKYGAEIEELEETKQFLEERKAAETKAMEKVISNIQNETKVCFTTPTSPSPLSPPLPLPPLCLHPYLSSLILSFPTSLLLST